MPNMESIEASTGIFNHFETIESWHSNINRADQHGSPEGSILRLPRHILLHVQAVPALLLYQYSMLVFVR